MVALSASESMTDQEELARVTYTLEAVCRTKDVFLVLGGEGPWPKTPEYAVRMGRFRDFHQLLVEITKAGM